MQIATLRIFLTALIVVISAHNADSKSSRILWLTRLNQRLVTFDYNCTSTKYVSVALQNRVRKEIQRSKYQGPINQGNQAIPILLRKGNPVILFVVANCGATGNCGWFLYNSRTHQFMGEIGGQFIYVRPGGTAWPAIISYTRMGGCEGVLTRYEYRSGRYREQKDYLSLNRCNPQILPLPGRLPQARRLCSQYGF